MGNSYLLSLLQLTDPTLPIGGFAHSAGLETYVQCGKVHNAATAKEFVVQMLTQSIQYTDAAFSSLAYDAANNKNLELLLLLDQECTAIKLPREIRQSSQKLGLRLLKIFSELQQTGLGNNYIAAVKATTTPGNYCIVFGLYANILGISKTDALTGFYFNAATAIITNCVKLIPLGQQEGQRILFSLQPVIAQLVAATIEPDRTRIGTCCAGFDIRSMQHEHLYSRLYMS